jgi:hypothetical protein
MTMTMKCCIIEVDRLPGPDGTLTPPSPCKLRHIHIMYTVCGILQGEGCLLTHSHPCKIRSHRHSVYLTGRCARACVCVHGTHPSHIKHRRVEAHHLCGIPWGIPLNPRLSRVPGVIDLAPELPRVYSVYHERFPVRHAILWSINESTHCVSYMETLTHRSPSTDRT